MYNFANSFFPCGGYHMLKKELSYHKCNCALGNCERGEMATQCVLEASANSDFIGRWSQKAEM